MANTPIRTQAHQNIDSTLLPKDPFDIVIIGGGPGGYVAAIRAAQLGMKVALIEGQHLGGVCLNWGCIPTKALLKSASMLSAAEHMASFGITLPKQDIKIDLAAMVQRSRIIANQLQLGVKGLLAKNKVTVFSAWAKFNPVNPQTSDHILHLTDPDGKTSLVAAKHVIIATGARARTLFPDDLGVWRAHQAMVPETIPQSLLIIGAGAIGVEFASFYRALGTDVTLIEQSSRILSVEDEEIVAIALASFVHQGIVIKTNSVAKQVEKRDDGTYSAIIANSKTGQERSWTGEKVLVAIGVIGNTDTLGLEHTSVKVEHGHIVTYAHQTTDELNVYAIGDVAGPPWLAHKASHEGIACVEYIAGMHTHGVDTTLIPGCTYSMPQIASIGLTEHAAAQKGPIKVGRFPFAANGQAMAYGESTGLVKVIFDEKTGELLGAHMVGAGVSELIQGFAIAKTLQATEADLKNVIFPHPTFSEMMHEAVLDADAMALHLFRSPGGAKQPGVQKTP
jgi:dihydrolipoamide dehydrogenase